MPNGTKNANNGDLGLKNRKSHECLHSWKLGGGFGVNEASPMAPFLCFHADDARPGELTLFFFCLQEFFAKFD